MTREVFFDPSEIIVSKTDLKGRITYANRVFCNVSGFQLKDLIGQPHSLIRHEDMPRAVFKLLWDNLQMRNEVFAYVKNLTKDGGFYWVFAHVTPTMGADGEIIGYHSSRRVPERELIRTVIEPLYAQLRAVEQADGNRKEAMEKSSVMLDDVVRSKASTYNEFIVSLAS